MPWCLEETDKPQLHNGVMSSQHFVMHESPANQDRTTKHFRFYITFHCCKWLRVGESQDKEDIFSFWKQIQFDIQPVLSIMHSQTSQNSCSDIHQFLMIKVAAYIRREQPKVQIITDTYFDQVFPTFDIDRMQIRKYIYW